MRGSSHVLDLESLLSCAQMSRSSHRDEVTLSNEVNEENIDSQELGDEILKCVSSACKVKIDRVEFLLKGTLQSDAKKIKDERTWD